ncbi:DUF2129 domain-containing protein [Oceanobacillus piezotolerans]|uniref:UPF0298 protein D8M04_10185 n=1 Tax=Oceanobacillus piezotolerans TaxID=2448030 RepID=A0A498D677_9BACI|nr:DUF2129 domain-containing protein [Oceanobacillus piezotolerans]RLL45218.1 DUF2129 domain-containing protein [Oceanobacillus piezotolerans]
MRTNRQGLVVWFQHMKNLKQIKRFGNLIYASKKLKYAIIYVNQSDVNQVENKLNRLPFVLKIEHSYKPFVRTDFENALPDKAKQYDYKMGI